MIELADPAPFVIRLAQALEPRAAERPDGARTRFLGPGDSLETPDRIARAGTSGVRVLVLGWIGTHPDARSGVLRGLWELEERCRATGLPTLALRLGPLVGPESPLWRLLAHTPPRGRLARKLVHPVRESDVVEALRRACAGHAAWEGWYEVGGPDILSLEELAENARLAQPPGGGGWEPDAGALAEQRLIEPEIWSRWCGVVPEPLAPQAARGTA